jgi:predicted ATPase/class 3 adenylate cyclase
MPSGGESQSRPDDTVVFLFTDIEASTRRWEGDQHAMAVDLARHDELLRAAVEEAGGRVFAHTGDGMCAAFATALRGLTAAVSAQLALVEEKWTSPVPLLVRMAIHAGAAEPRGDNYVGPSLNRAARLLSLAAGGQMLCSQAVTDLVRDDLPPDVSLIDLGEHDLADLSRPERVFQIFHPELPSEFPVLRSSSRRRHNLPTALTSFIGRASELEQVQGLLGESRLVTLSGVGGSGKTRLALEAAAGSIRAFPDGAWVIELGPVRNQALVPSTAASALGVVTTGSGAMPDAVTERLCEYLESRTALLIFENCEHLVEGVVPLVHALLANCAGVTILATSREILGLAGEVAWRVPPLSLPASSTVRVEDLANSDAAALFCERARAAQPGFDLNAANAAAVVQICHRLDGIPLALELAAARIRVLGAHDLARRLDQRFRVLTGGDRTAVPRHQTLQATMDWSHDLLPADEQVTLRRLAVFPGSFDLEAAEAVVQGSEDLAPPAGDVLDLISRLVDKSLVAVDSQGVETRFRLLETVREYAAGKLGEASEISAIRRRHRDYFLTVGSTQEDRADPTRTWSTGDWIRRADADHDSFRSALEWSLSEDDGDAAVGLAAALWRYWWWARPLEGYDWLTRALARSDGASPERLEAQIGLGFLLPKSGRGSVKQGEDHLREALRRAVEAGVDMAAARARYFLGELLSRRAPEEAERLLQEALGAFEAMAAPLSAAWCHHALAWLAVATGDRRRAETSFENALEVARREAPAELLRVHAAAGLAPLAALDGDAARAESLADDAVGAARRLPAAGFLVMALTRASETALLSGRRPAAQLREVVGLLLDLGSRAWVVEVLEMAALVCGADGRPLPAARLLGACAAIEEAAGDQAQGRVLFTQVTACRNHLASTLGAESLAEQESLGRHMSIGEALTLASDELDLLQPQP